MLFKLPRHGDGADVLGDLFQDLDVAEQVLSGLDGRGIAPAGMIGAVKLVQDFLEQFVVEEMLGNGAALDFIGQALSLARW